MPPYPPWDHWVGEVKACNACLRQLPVEKFYVRARMKDGYSGQCKSCEIARQREYQNKPGVRERRNAQSRARGPRPAEQVRRQRLWTWHRITVEAFDARLAAQGGVCAIRACGTDKPGGKGWHIDHDHACCDTARSCGECIRGILCTRCNVMLGMARDDRDILREAAEYLNDNAAMSALGPLGG